MKETHNFAKPNQIAKDMQHLYQSIYEGKKVDQDEDGDNDFADVRIARMIASGVPKAEAIRKTRKKVYNKENYELDQLAILYLMQEGYAKDLRGAQAIYENASLGFKQSLLENPALLAAAAELAPLAARALPAAGRFLASPTGQSAVRAGGRLLRSPTARKAGRAGLEWAMSKLQGEGENENQSQTSNRGEESDSSSNNSGIVGMLRSASRVSRGQPA